MIPIPLICERCRAEGVAGEDLFERYAGLTDFTPVPRRPRADGWDAEVQRAFIVALAATGSVRQAAAAVGKAQFGVEQLKKAKGNESFMAAYDRALEIHEEEKSRRLAEGLAAVAGPAARWQVRGPAWANAATRARLEARQPRSATGKRTRRSSSGSKRWSTNICSSFARSARRGSPAGSSPPISTSAS